MKNELKLIELDIKVQSMQETINSANTFSMRDKLDDRYRFLVGIGIMKLDAETGLPGGVLPVNTFSQEAILEMVSVKGNLLFPPDFNLMEMATLPQHEPNRRFYGMFQPVSTNGDEIEIRFKDPAYASDYLLNVNLLLTNTLEEAKYVLHG